MKRKIVDILSALVVAVTLMLVTAVPALAAPAVTSVTETAFGTDMTNHYVNMPATVDAGDLLIALFTNDGSATVTTPAGWTQLASTANGAAIRLSVYYKIAEGTEGGSTVNFVTSAAEQAAAQVYRIANWHGTTPPEISTAATGVSTRPNPASLSPAGWGVADTLWLAVVGQDRGDQSGTTAYPTYYANGISAQSSEPATTGVCRTHSARRVLAAASEDPGAFTIPVAEEWVAFNIAVGPAPHNLATSSTGGGSVTEPGEGMFTYGEGAVVDLVAEADEGYRFDEWTGDVGTIADVYAAATNIIMNGDYSIMANFVKQYNLVIVGTEGGSVTEPGEDVFTYDTGTVVDLVAASEEGYRFVEWIGDVGTIADVYAATTTITMNGDYSITASFVKQYHLTTCSTEGGSVTGPGEDTFTYDEGTVVDLVAASGEGYRFAEWTGDVGTISDVYAATTTITMNGDYSITANFVRQYDLTILSTDGGSVAEPGEDTFTYDEGTVVDLVATPDASYRFVEWTGDVSTIADVYAATTAITMNGDRCITANFVTQHDLTTSSTSGGNVNPPGEGTFAYDESTVVNLVATPDASYRFVSWAGDVDTVADVYAATTTIIMNDDYSITAVFQILIPPPWGSSGGCFIATAAYGTPTAKQIDVLREFRDTVLLNNTIGSQFVALYYRFSPPVAQFIAGNELLRTVVREFLVAPVVRVIDATGHVWRN
jgi:Divergent InlB B-repeat domain